VTLPKLSRLTLMQRVMILTALSTALLLAVTVPPLYDVLLWMFRLVLVTYAVQKAVELMGPVVGDPLGFLAGVGGILYGSGLILEQLGLRNINGRDLDFLVRVIGLAFLVLPFALAGLPRRTRQRIGLAGDC
jgi:hypothetical protein